jgi:hypothetical protein
MARAIDVGDAAAGSGGGAALMAELETTEQRKASAAAAPRRGEGAGSEAGGDTMEVDAVLLSAELASGLQGVVDHEPSAALKTSAAALLKRIG